MSDNNENIERQADEIEALSAIYGDEWCVLDPISRLFCIKVTDGEKPSIWKVNLHVHLPDGYPLTVPPEYQINGGWLRGEERIHIQNKLDQIYCDNIGEDVIFMWVEALREFLQDKADKDHDPQSSSGFSNRSEETEDGDDDFDVTQLGDFQYERFEPVPVRNSLSDCPAIVHGETVTDRKSTFQPHLAVITHKEQISQVLSKLYENKKIANATHNMLAYRIGGGGQDGVVYQGCEDDGETHAGSRMLHLLQIMNADNVMVVVSRWYGGIHLGPDRFKHINNCTRQVLEQNGFLREKEEKRGPRSGKKAR